MPNRIIKESICTSYDIDSLTWFEEVVFYRLIVKADDYGRYYGDPKIIHGQCFPLKEVKTDDLADALANLEAHGMIQRYSVEGKPYIQFTNWEKHQTVRSKKSKFPGLSTESEITCKQMNANVPVIQSNPIRIRESESYSGILFENPNPNPIRESESNPNPNSVKVEVVDETESWFNSFWKEYPRKTKKPDALKAFKRKCKSETDFNIIMAGLYRWIPAWDDPKYIPYPASWLNGEQYNDDPPKSKKEVFAF